MTDHFRDICCHGVEWVHCGCDDPGFDDDMTEPLDECPWCGEVECDEDCTAALLAGGAQ